LSVSSLPKEDRVLRAFNILNRVPEPNRSTCQFLIRSLQRFIANQEVTKMNSKNLAVVFAPSLLTKDEDEKNRQLRSTSASEGGADAMLLMAKMSMDVDQHLAFVIALLDDTPKVDWFNNFLLSIFTCSRSRR
jgi:hypothetical protein